ncbi:putative envelope ADP [Abeliophyllum distichum]|uniref:Envelope ADP n=1 Tax=Abeliophyllum distichum TaxID=126358 RepID=A0ABD1QTD0_9LAMI
MDKTRATLVWREIPGLDPTNFTEPDQWRRKWFTENSNSSRSGSRCNFACISVAEKREEKEFSPTSAQLVKHPLALVALVPKDVALFAAGAVAGAAAKTVTAPLDRIKLLMQTHGIRAGQAGAKKAIGFIEAFALIGKEEGIKGYWKGNLPQVIRIIPYSAVQLFAYETYKKLFRGKDGDLSVIGRLAAGACAGMTSTFWEVEEFSPNLLCGRHQLVADAVIHHLEEPPLTAVAGHQVGGCLAEGFVIREQVLEVDHWNIQVTGGKFGERRPFGGFF